MIISLIRLRALHINESKGESQSSPNLYLHLNFFLNKKPPDTGRRNTSKKPSDSPEEFKISTTLFKYLTFSRLYNINFLFNPLPPPIPQISETALLFKWLPGAHLSFWFKSKHVDEGQYETLVE